MATLGFDPHSDSYTVVALDENGMTLASMAVSNSTEGLVPLQRFALPFEEGASCAEVLIHDGRESKTVYHHQAIPHTDFPLPSTKLYIQENGRE